MLSYSFEPGRSQSIKIDIGNQMIQSISIADCYQLLSEIDNNRQLTEKSLYLLLSEYQLLSITKKFDNHHRKHMYRDSIEL